MILSLTSDLTEQSYDDGDTVIAEGEWQDRLLILVSGAAAVSREDVEVSVIDEPGSIFGELAALLNGPATATVRAAGPCVFRVCDEPMAFLGSRPEVALTVATTLARRLDGLTRYLVDLRNQYADRDDQLGLVDVVLESISHHQGGPPDPGSDREQSAPY